MHAEIIPIACSNWPLVASARAVSAVSRAEDCVTAARDIPGRKVETPRLHPGDAKITGGKSRCVYYLLASERFAVHFPRVACSSLFPLVPNVPAAR